MNRDSRKSMGSLEKPRSGRACHQVNPDALSSTDWAYLYGLYFTDGNVTRGYHVRFCLQGNEEDIAQKVAGMIRKLGLKSTISRWSNKNMIIVQSYSKRLADFLPNKETIMNNPRLANEFMQEKGLLLNFGFCAGLIDGDGTCKAYQVNNRSKREGSFGTIRVLWTFSQTKFPYLRKVFKEFVEFLVPKSTAEIHARGRVEGVRVNTRGRNAMLRLGLAERSWKASRFVESFSSLIAEQERKRSEWASKIDSLGMRMRVVSQFLGIPYKTLINWKERGKLCTALVYEGGGKGKLVVPTHEVDRLHKLILNRAQAAGFMPR